MSEPKGARAVAVLLWVSAATTVLYWLVFFTSGDVQSTEEPCYLVFERAFPAADGWMAALLVGAAEGLRRRRDWALLCGIGGGASVVYLGCMDVLYNLENGMYARMNAAMLGEAVINLFCFTFGPFLLWWFWTNRAALEVRT